MEKSDLAEVQNASPCGIKPKRPRASKKKISNTQKAQPRTKRSGGPSKSCHQCRQSIYSSKGISELKNGKERLKCGHCCKVWCEQCLLNRYGIIQSQMDPLSWMCPFCMKKCNCSVCRKKAGKIVTGILTPLAKKAGFQSVSELLDAGVDDILDDLKAKSPTPTEENLSQGADDIIKLLQRKSPSPASLAQDVTQGADEIMKLLQTTNSPSPESLVQDNIISQESDIMVQANSPGPTAMPQDVSQGADEIMKLLQTNSPSPTALVQDIAQGADEIMKLLQTTNSLSPTTTPQNVSQAKSCSRKRQRPQEFQTKSKKRSKLQSGIKNGETITKFNEVTFFNPGDQDVYYGSCHGNATNGHSRELEHSLYTITVEIEEDISWDHPFKPVGSCDGAWMGSQFLNKILLVELDSSTVISPTLPVSLPLDNIRRPIKTQELPCSEIFSNTPSPSRRSSRKKKFTSRYSSDQFELDMPDSSEADSRHNETTINDKSMYSLELPTLGFGAQLEEKFGWNSNGITNVSQEKMRRYKCSVDKVETLMESPEKLKAFTSHGNIVVAKSRTPIYKFKSGYKWKVTPCLKGQRKMEGFLSLGDNHQYCERLVNVMNECGQGVPEEDRLLPVATARGKMEEKRLLHRAAAEKVQMTHRYMSEVHRATQRRQREEEKRKQLLEWRERKMSIRRQVQDLVNMSLNSEEEETNLADDSPESCDLAGIPPLPTLPPMPLPLSSALVPSFLFVSEFLHTFHDALGIPKKVTAKDLYRQLLSGRGLTEVYKQLLKLIMEEDSKLRNELGRSRKQKDLEKLAKKYLQEHGRNGFVVKSGRKQSIEKSVVILNHLCHDVLETGFLDDAMEESHLKVDRLLRDHKSKEKEKCREIVEELKRVHEGGGVSLEVESKREDITTDLDEMKRSSELACRSCSLAVRNTSLGTDRHGRMYWKMQSVPGVVVESCSMNNNDEENSEGSREWSVINSAELLQQITDSLHPEGKREKSLLHSLQLLKANVLKEF